MPQTIACDGELPPLKEIIERILRERPMLERLESQYGIEAIEHYRQLGYIDVRAGRAYIVERDDHHG